MIASISGIVINKRLDSLIIETSGVGYLVFTTSAVLASSQLNKPIKLMTHMVVREDHQSLYGFPTQEELQLFSMLLSVSGIGPKAALAILNSGQATELKSAIAHGDSAIFTAISGVGSKTAQRLILELKNKIGSIGADITSGDSEEIINALAGLGYNMYEIRQVLGKISRQMSLEEKVKEALKLLG